MKSSVALKVLLGFSLLGVLFSGYLSYNRYFGAAGCAQGFFSCAGNGRPVLIIGQPTCIYGFAMFLVIAILTILAIRSTQPKSLINSSFVLGLIGVLFSIGVASYELWGIDLAFNQLPACVYGFFIFLGIFIASWIARKQVDAPLPPTEASTPAVN